MGSSDETSTCPILYSSSICSNTCNSPGTTTPHRQHQLQQPYHKNSTQHQHSYTANQLIELWHQLNMLVDHEEVEEPKRSKVDAAEEDAQNVYRIAVTVVVTTVEPNGDTGLPIAVTAHSHRAHHASKTIKTKRSKQKWLSRSACVTGHSIIPQRDEETAATTMPVAEGAGGKNLENCTTNIWCHIENPQAMIAKLLRRFAHTAYCCNSISTALTARPLAQPQIALMAQFSDLMRCLVIGKPRLVVQRPPIGLPMSPLAQRHQHLEDERNCKWLECCQRSSYANYQNRITSASSLPLQTKFYAMQQGADERTATIASGSGNAILPQPFGYNYCNLLRRSISLYTASSFLLVLCCLTTSITRAYADEPPSFDKHPIQVLDWSKFDESSSDKEILDLLLEKTRYDKRLLPPVNDEDFCCGLSSPDMAKAQNTRKPHKRGTLTVNVNVLLLSLASPDESSLKYEVEFLLNQQWNDPRLQYGNKSHYDFLNALHHHDSIWTPDTYFIMHGDFKHPIIPMHFALRIYRNGTITYAMRRHLILSCQGSLHIFPFDDPKCSFSMESISYEEAQIKYVWKNDEDTLRKSPSLTTLNAYLIKNQTTACDQNSWRGHYSCLRVDLIFTRDRAFYFTTVFIPGIILVTSSFITFWLEWNAVPARSMIGNYSCLQVELTFTRDRAYYFTTVFIPGIILVTSSFITFWLEWNAVPARVMIGVTTMLNFFTTSNGFRSTLPVVSNLTAMNVWDGVCMCFIYASLLEFVCVNYVGRKRPLHNVVYRPGENPVTQRLPAVLSRIGVILASPLEVIEREFHAALSSEKVASTAVSPTTTRTTTPLPATTTELQWEDQRGRSIIRSALQNRQWRSLRVRRTDAMTAFQTVVEPFYAEPVFKQTPTAPPPPSQAASVVVGSRDGEATLPQSALSITDEFRPRSRSVSTNTPQLVAVQKTPHQQQQQMPIKPPRKKPSRSTSPAGMYEDVPALVPPQSETLMIDSRSNDNSNGGGAANGEKRRDAGGMPNEIVACTTCGGSNSPCTHSANNGCATESCFVQVRKKEPPHPIRVAKTIDVIARITFPTAYAIFLIFFFVHYKGFS